jgi:hypothetical protein
MGTLSLTSGRELAKMKYRSRLPADRLRPYA